MATGDQDDILARLKALLPPTWFGDDHPFLTAILTACAQALTWCYSLYIYAQLQTRINTATDGWLDLIAYDFFGTNYGRTSGQSDDVFRNGIKINLFRERGTRHSVQKILEDLTGNTPFIFEPQRPLDTGAYGAAVAVSRSTIGSYVDTFGIVRYAEPNTVRYDANPYSLSTNGLLVEPSNTNIVPFSSDFIAATWGKTRCTPVAYAGIAPDGTNNATYLVPTTDNNTHVLGTQSLSASGGSTYVFSIYVKSGAYSQLRIRAGDSAGFLLDTVVDTSTGSIVAGTVTAKVTALANSWYRVSLPVTTSAAASFVTMQLWVYLSGSATFAGDGSSGILIYGAQIESGSSETSYIPTLSTSFMRGADTPINNMTTNSTFLGGYGLTGGYGSQLIPYQAFVTAYRPSGAGIPFVAGYSSTPSGYSIASRGEYASQTMLTGSVTDAQIYAAVASVKMEGTIAWVNILSQPDPAKRRVGIDFVIGESQL
ncbi:hypothetical protein J1782_25265 [Rahnella sp. BCC 1045]|uniref:phage head spike fiber domain-containing protein n=1 Tax=Rahnella sp. BCC 1045 TaxID=2816251 RepID=UPI001C26ABF8|nr:hypothetical protein [Rahnella sp. BCC 1045]MBU9823205.1 hypothetical protein [Rahnella sp. BCC 1045]